MEFRKSTPEKEGTFNGEMMTCIMCGKQERSHPNIVSGWRCIDTDGTKFYVCPAEFPPDWAHTRKFQKAYTRVLDRIMELRNQKPA